MTGNRADYFWAKVDKSNGCWLWQGRMFPDGYGKYGNAGALAHRVAYELTFGSIPVGLELDHLCRVTSCVNPMHLEPVTKLENIRRRYAIQTHCKNGHEFSEENTRIRNGRRACRSCDRAKSSRYAAKKRAAA